MVQLINPLFSNTASGRLGGLVYSGNQYGQYVKAYTPQHRKPTGLQLKYNFCFGICADKWRLLTTEQKQDYIDRAKGQQMTGFNLWIKENLDVEFIRYTPFTYRSTSSEGDGQTVQTSDYLMVETYATGTYSTRQLISNTSFDFTIIDHIVFDCKAINCTSSIRTDVGVVSNSSSRVSSGYGLARVYNWGNFSRRLLNVNTSSVNQLGWAGFECRNNFSPAVHYGQLYVYSIIGYDADNNIVKVFLNLPDPWGL